MSDESFPTTDQALNGVLRDLVASAQAVLGANFVAAYLQGSFAVGDWDADSDVDFLIATQRDPSEAEEAALNAMHARIFRLPSQWAQHLDGSYFPTDVLRRREAARIPLLYLNNTSDTLERSIHDDTWVIRWVTRERGVTLAGPEPATLIEPIPADAMRQEILENMRRWADDIAIGRHSIANQWAQPFFVLIYCRMLQSLETGRIESKRAGAQWAQRTLDSRWAPLIQRAWEARPNPSLKVRQPSTPEDQQATLDFIQYAITLSEQDRSG